MSAQSMESLALANEVRLRRAELKRGLKRGEAQIVSVLGEEVPDWLGTMRLGELLEALPRVGPSKAYQYIAKIGNVSYTRRLDRLTTRQKFDLLALLDAKEIELARQRKWKANRLNNHTLRHQVGEGA